MKKLLFLLIIIICFHSLIHIGKTGDWTGSCVILEGEFHLTSRWDILSPFSKMDNSSIFLWSCSWFIWWWVCLGWLGPLMQRQSNLGWLGLLVLHYSPLTILLEPFWWHSPGVRKTIPKTHLSPEYHLPDCSGDPCPKNKLLFTPESPL